MLQTLTTTITAASAAMAPPSSSPKPKRSNPTSPPLSSSSSTCNHSPSAPIDLILLILVVSSSVFLISSSLYHILRSLSHFLPSSHLLLLLLLLLSSLLLLLLLLLHATRLCSRKCSNPKCRGLKKALEFDVQVQSEECVREKGKDWKEIEDLPWKGGQMGRNPDYELLRAELRKMAPVNGRAVLLFRARCGCPVARLEAWGPKKGRQRHKRSMANLALEGGDR